MHARGEIRNEVVARLTNHTAAGDHVRVRRLVPWASTDLPALSVYMLPETVAVESRHTAPRVLNRFVDMAIEAEVVLKPTDSIDDALDVYALQIEKVMHRDPRLGERVVDLMLKSTEIDVSEAGDQPIGMVRLIYGIEYDTDAVLPDDELFEPFETVDIAYNLQDAQVDPELTHDRLNLAE